MNKLLRAVLPIALVAAGAMPSFSADYDPPIVIDAVDDYVPVEVGNGWYLRGDLGYSLSTSASGAFNYRTFDPLTSTYSGNSFATGRLSESINYGIGFGYQYNEWVRGDLTLSAFEGRFNGTTAGATPCIDPAVDPAFAGTSCRSESGARFSAISFMANAYADLGTYAGFTPYVGAGAGATLVKWGNLRNNLYCVDGVGVCPAPGGVVGTTVHRGQDSWRFTYALMGGVAYDISKNLKLDLGYRYSRVAGGSMFAFDAGSAAAGASGVQGRDPGFSQHEVRVGLRYALW